jgi:hypothetical protein
LLCLKKVLDGEGLERFTIGNVIIPKFYGAYASCLDMVIFLTVAGIAVVGALLIERYYDYYQEKEEQDFKKKYQIKDENETGAFNFIREKKREQVHLIAPKIGEEKETRRKGRKKKGRKKKRKKR